MSHARKFCETSPLYNNLLVESVCGRSRVYLSIFTSRWVTLWVIKWMRLVWVFTIDVLTATSPAIWHLNHLGIRANIAQIAKVRAYSSFLARLGLSRPGAQVGLPGKISRYGHCQILLMSHRSPGGHPSLDEPIRQCWTMAVDVPNWMDVQCTAAAAVTSHRHTSTLWFSIFIYLK